MTDLAVSRRNLSGLINFNSYHINPKMSVRSRVLFVRVNLLSTRTCCTTDPAINNINDILFWSRLLMHN